jgi:hypothetical protein
MQTVELKFTKLDKMPVPESKSDRLLVLVPHTGAILVTIANVEDKTGRLFFDEAINPDFDYCHVKVVRLVTAATEPSFKVGDRVQMIGGYKQYIIQEILGNVALLQQNSDTTLQLLTDLTLITE